MTLLYMSILAHSAAAALLLPTFIASDMVLQRAPMKARLWGVADGGT